LITIKEKKEEEGKENEGEKKQVAIIASMQTVKNELCTQIIHRFQDLLDRDKYPSILKLFESAKSYYDQGDESQQK
jgi:hypothetical protein